MEQEQKRRVATKKRIEEFRAANKEYTDEKITALVEDMYPNKFKALDVALEIVKELYRESLPLTDETFQATLQRLCESRKLLRYDLEEIAATETHIATQKLIEKIYNDANKGTRYLSQYPEYSGAVKEGIERSAKEREYTVAKYLYYLLNNEARYQSGEYNSERWSLLNFHCYSEPNGDVIFTKERRSISDYDEEGKPIARQGSGCASVFLFAIALVIIAFYL